MASKTTSSTDRGLPISAKTLQTLTKPVIGVLTWVVPVGITATRKIYHGFQKLPQNCMKFMTGSVFCFFGGMFPTLFAAVQAAEHGGRKTVMSALNDLADEALIIIEENKKDDKIDADKDGKSDVHDLTPTQLFHRKTTLVLRKMNPDKIDKAVASMYRVWLSVAAVLSIQFARTINMALSIADFLKKPVDRFIAPTLNLAIPDEYEKWTPVVITWVVKAIAMSIAWYIQSVMSAFTSALTGGLMMAQAAYHFCVHRNITLFGLIPKDHTKSNVDEFLSYLFAGLGFYFQFKHAFILPAPLNLILWPFQVAEQYIRWTITYKKA